MTSDLYEVGGGVDEPVEPHAAVAAGLPRSYWTVFSNGQPIHHYPTFEQAMRHAFPGWEPDCSFGETCETWGDKL